MPQPLMPKELKLTSSLKTYKTKKLTKKGMSLRHREVGCKKQEVKRYLAKQVSFSLGVQNEAGQSLTKFCQENALVIANTISQQQQR